MMRPLLLASLLAGLSLSPALAQYRPAGAPNGVDAARARAPAPRPAPSAVPGSRADSELSRPAARTNADMPPTEALFDAINRGDLAGAKDAVGRGADLGGHNVLGLTPLELAIDLGRNEISFLLLSLRGDAGYTVAGPPRAAPDAKPDRRAQREAEAEARRQAAAARREAAQSVRQAGPAGTARLFAGNGGAPVPQAGFLGFDANR